LGQVSSGTRGKIKNRGGDTGGAWREPRFLGGRGCGGQNLVTKGGGGKRITTDFSCNRQKMN